MAHSWTHDRVRGAALVLALVPSGCIAPAAPSRMERTVVAPAPPEASIPDPDRVVARLVDAHNRARAKAGLPALRVDPRLQAAAQAHARDMAAHGRMRHRGSDGSNPFQRVEAEGYRFQRAGENVAYGQPTPEAVMQSWMNSPGHKRNILGHFTQIGAARAIAADGRPYWCVTFGDPFRG